MKNVANKVWKNISDADYIKGLKQGDVAVHEAFFYGLCNYTLNDIRVSLMKNSVEYDDLVSELYIYLSADNWHKLDTFKGLNGCSLRSWLVRIAWNHFMKYNRILRGIVSENIDEMQVCETSEDWCGRIDHLDVEISMDVNAVFALMGNERYVQVLKWMLIEGFDASEVALRLHTKVTNVYNIKHRAIVEFIKLYQSRR